MALEGGLQVVCRSQFSYTKWYGDYSLSGISQSIPRLLLQYGATFNPVANYGNNRTCWSEIHGWLPRLMRQSSQPDYIRRIFIENLDNFTLESLGNCDRWLIAILCHTYPVLYATLQRQLGLVDSESFRKCPIELHIPTVLRQAKAVPIEDRRLLISTICQFGTVSMIDLFIQDGFDLNERLDTVIPGLHDIELHYLRHAAKVCNIEAIQALVAAGARLKESEDFISLFTDGIHRRAHDTISFIEAAFSCFDFNDNETKPTLLKRLIRVERYLRFENRQLAITYIVDGLVDRGCTSSRPPMSRQWIYGEEVFNAAEYCVVWDHESGILLHLLNKYNSCLEHIGLLPTSSYEDVTKATPLGVALKRGTLSTVRVLLDAGADIDTPIPDGLSALEIAKEIVMRKGSLPYVHGTEADWEEKAFDLILQALRRRKQDHIADAALFDVRGFPAEKARKLTSMLRAIGVPKKIRSILDHILGYEQSREGEEFRKAFLQWKDNLLVITALSLDGILIRLGFVLSLSIAVAFELSRGFSRLKLLTPSLALKAIIVYLLVWLLV